MNKNILKLSVCVMPLLFGNSAIADSEYPAADFQPKVIFNDSANNPTSHPAEATTDQMQSGATDQNYPAADFQPKVVYQDEAIGNKPSNITPESSVATATDVADASYPAANFQPKVLYSDPLYKPSAALSVSQNKTVASSVASPVAQLTASSKAKAEVTAVPEVKKEESDSFGLLGIGLLALVAIGFARFRRTSEIQAGTSSTSGHNGLTGVSRYLAAHDKSSALTGVAKYLAKQAEASHSSSVPPKTGVEKYLRNRS